MADVCLLLEGTYPYVTGGVSSVVHRMIASLPNTSFQLVFIGVRFDEMLRLKYTLPPNVEGVQEIFLYDDFEHNGRTDRPLKSRQLKSLQILHYYLHQTKNEGAPLGRLGAARLSSALNVLFPAKNALESPLFRSLSSKEMWHLLKREYYQLGADIPFIEFFYTWRSAHIPIYRILSHQYPRAKIYHSMCTGYAGLAGVQAAQQNRAPLFISEHGIYAWERAIEIAKANWLYTPDETQLFTEDAGDRMRRWWVDFFRNMSRIAYGYASEIITLYEDNQRRQIEDGASPEKSRIIPNGVSSKFQGLRLANPPWSGPSGNRKMVLGFIGRIVPIKDILTLVKAVRAVADRFPNIICNIVGPWEEDEDYYEQCLNMVHFLGLKDVIFFKGKMKAEEVYQTIDLLLLTSISEAQPLVILESNSAGVPVVATDVGSCRELLDGRTEADLLLGRSGLIANPGDAEGIAERILQFVYSPDLWADMQQAGMQRVASFYQEAELMSEFDVLYRSHIAGAVGQGAKPWQA